VSYLFLYDDRIWTIGRISDRPEYRVTDSAPIDTTDPREWRAAVEEAIEGRRDTVAIVLVCAYFQPDYCEGLRTRAQAIAYVDALRALRDLVELVLLPMVEAREERAA
jgi:hypothetical protein